jgi:dihydrodipicolinate synthase/N-acetylneuraminate lyase
MDLRKHLLAGQVIPAHPLALDEHRFLSEKHQRALTRYYFDSGAGGVAVGVHSTQFEIRDPRHGLFEPVLELASRAIDEAQLRAPRDFVKIAGVCGRTPQAMREAGLARGLGYDAALLSFSALNGEAEDVLLEHAAAISGVLPVIGFYLQTAVGGRVLSQRFWRRFAEIPGVVAIKLAPFNRYRTIDVVRAVVESGRTDLALYTGNDDTIVTDLLTPFEFEREGRKIGRRIEGGLLGHWGVWTRAAVELFEKIKRARNEAAVAADWLRTAAAVTDMNAALFDAANDFKGCIPGILEVLRRQGLVPSAHCLDPHETLSAGQADELTRVTKAYPALTDDDFVAGHLDRWLR